MKRGRAKRALLFLLFFIFLFSLPLQQGCQMRVKTREEQILSALKAGQTTIWLPTYALKSDEVHTLYSTLLSTEPSLFFVAPYYTSCTGAFDYVAYFKPQYRFSGDALTTAQAEYEAYLAPLLSPASQMPTERERITYLHDYLTHYFTYDNTQSIYDAYSLLKEGRGVCQAFSLLFFDLCRRLDIPSQIVICPAMRHQWNRVCLDGVWLEVDLVWDIAEGADSYFLIPHEDLRAARVARDPAWQDAKCTYYG